MENLADKKRAILESTLELIKENGFHGTPMSQVAKNANVAAGTIYHYFDSKETLICHLYAYVKDEILETMFSGDDADLPYKKRFTNIWINLYNFYIENSKVLVFFEQFVNSPFYNKRPTPQVDTFERLHRFFEEGTTKGYFRSVNPNILSMLVHGSIITTAKLQMAGKITVDEPELQQIIDVLWSGMQQTG